MIHCLPPLHATPAFSCATSRRNACMPASPVPPKSFYHACLKYSFPDLPLLVSHISALHIQSCCPCLSTAAPQLAALEVFNDSLSACWFCPIDSLVCNNKFGSVQTSRNTLSCFQLVTASLSGGRIMWAVAARLKNELRGTPPAAIPFIHITDQVPVGTALLLRGQQQTTE
jgi:hypothetical protein